MSLGQLNSPSFWHDIARESWFQLTLPHLEVSQLTWKLPKSALAESRLLWPKSYSWPSAEKWLEQLRIGFMRHLPVERVDYLPKASAKHVENIVLRFGNKDHIIAIDYSDYPTIDEEAAKDSFCYFKMQFRNAGYELPNVFPAGFVVNDESIYKYATKFRVHSRPQRFELYGRFSLNFATKIRSSALEKLRTQSEFSFEGSAKRVRYSRFLEEAASSKLALDLPGNGEFCFRLVDYFALGCAVVSPKHLNRMHVPLEEGRHIVYCARDLSDLVEVCSATRAQESKLKSLRREARTYFDKYLHREQLTAYYLDECFKRI